MALNNALDNTTSVWRCSSTRTFDLQRWLQYGTAHDAAHADSVLATLNSTLVPLSWNT
jgi:hypothetical protein